MQESMSLTNERDLGVVGGSDACEERSPIHTAGVWIYLRTLLAIGVRRDLGVVGGSDAGEERADPRPDVRRDLPSDSSRQRSLYPYPYTGKQGLCSRASSWCCQRGPHAVDYTLRVSRMTSDPRPHGHRHLPIQEGTTQHVSSTLT